LSFDLAREAKSISTIKRSREEKLVAMTNLKESLAAKRKQVEEERKAKLEKEKELATAVAGSVIMAPAIQQGSRMVGKPIFVAPPEGTKIRPMV